MRIVWATNVAAPYRLPVWQELATRCDLEVWLLADNEHNRRWSRPRDENQFRHRQLSTISLRRGEDTYYWTTSRLGAVPDALILPAWNQPAAWQLLRWARRQSATTLAFNESTLASRRHVGGVPGSVRGRFHHLVDHVLTVSPSSTEAVLQLGVPHDRLTECTNAVDVGHFAQAASIGDADGPHTFIFCGQLIERKRPDLVLEALTHLEDQSSRLHVIGQGPLEAKLREQAKSLGLRRRVDFAGYVEPDRLPDYFARGHTLVMPSEREVHGLVAAEGLAAGMHVVVSRRAGVASIVGDMRGCYLTEPELTSLATAMSSSQRDWTGRIRESEILSYTPRKMAKQVESGIRVARLGYGR